MALSPYGREKREGIKFIVQPLPGGTNKQFEVNLPSRPKAQRKRRTSSMGEQNMGSGSTASTPRCSGIMGLGEDKSAKCMKNRGSNRPITLAPLFKEDRLRTKQSRSKSRGKGKSKMKVRKEEWDDNLRNLSTSKIVFDDSLDKRKQEEFELQRDLMVSSLSSVNQPSV